MIHSPAEEDTALWAHYTKSLKRVQSLKPRSDLSGKKKNSPQKTKSTQVSAKPLPDKISVLAAVKLDKQRERELVRGEIKIEAKLDLHGMTEAEAHKKLIRFIGVCRADGLRCVLVITGKGRQGQSVLRANFPRWCETNPLQNVVMAVRPATLRHGGDGAFYVLLRKNTK